MIKKNSVPSTRISRRQILKTITVLAAGLFPAFAFSAEFPSKPVTIVVPFSAGGTTDIVSRIYGKALGTIWNQPVVIENKSGAGGNIGSASVARTAADGYTLLMGTIGTHAINKFIYKAMPFDPIKDFEPIMLTASNPNVLVVPKDAQYNNTKELLAYAKEHPDTLTFGSSGVGSSVHMAGELFKRLTGVNMIHVPYKGSGPAEAALAGGHISMMFDNLPAAIAHIRTGDLKALAITSAQRSNALPDVPTLEEQGIKPYNVNAWFGLFAPAGTPQAVVEKINRDVITASRTSEVQQILKTLGATVEPQTPAEFAAFIAREAETWEATAKSANLSVE